MFAAVTAAASAATPAVFPHDRYQQGPETRAKLSMQRELRNPELTFLKMMKDMFNNLYFTGYIL